MDKLIKIGFGVFAIGAIFFGVLQLRQNMKLTFPNKGLAQEEATNAALTETRLRLLDTDKDGLKDWDEQNVYNTSAYLADSDSDGVNDREEIEKGSDPNCPIGRECGSSVITSRPQLPRDQSFPGTEVIATATTSDSVSISEIIPEDLSADEIRALLVEGGVSEADLKDVNDEDLLKLFRDVLAGQAQ